MLTLPEPGYTPANLASLRAKLRLTQTQLAEQLGVTQRTAARWEAQANTHAHSTMPHTHWLSLLEIYKRSVDSDLSTNQ